MTTDLERCEENLEAAEVEAEQLKEAISTRAPIEQAKGMLKLLLSCDDDFAFQLLTRVSQSTHTKLSVVASELCERLTGSNDIPPEFTRAYQRLKATETTGSTGG